MKDFLLWLATILIGISFILPFVVQPSIATLVTMLLGCIGLVLLGYVLYPELRAKR